LYQDELEMVPLEKELACLKDLIFLEQNNFSRSSNINVEVRGDATNKYIPPMIILALMQESVTLLSRDNLESYHVNCQINIQNNHLHVNKTFSGSQKNMGSDAGWLSVINNTKNRLNAFFPQTEYQIGITEENGKTIITLNMPVPASPYVQDVKTPAQPKSTFYEPA
jgi:LytS/YehU family sensor histidine kinase